MHVCVRGGKYYVRNITPLRGARDARLINIHTRIHVCIEEEEREREWERLQQCCFCRGVQQGFTRFRPLPISVPNEPLNPRSPPRRLYYYTFYLTEIFMRNICSPCARVHVYAYVYVRVLYIDIACEITRWRRRKKKGSVDPVVEHAHRVRTNDPCHRFWRHFRFVFCTARHRFLSSVPCYYYYYYYFCKSWRVMEIR